MKINDKTSAHKWLCMIVVMIMAIVGASGVYAQNSLPAPGAGGSYRPAPIGGGWGIGPGMGNPGFAPGSMWGSPWGPGWSGSINSPSWTDQGMANVVACGYDNSGVWRVVPLHVAYAFNGIDYDVTVLSAYNPWTDRWVRGLSQPAYNTNIYLRGQSYDFYTNLPTGTYYFNL